MLRAVGIGIKGTVDTKVNLVRVRSNTVLVRNTTGKELSRSKI
jgi:hypothetical protein